MDKIVVHPKKVRGLGNVLNHKSLNDYFLHYSNLTETVDNLNDSEEINAYIMDYDPTVFTVSTISLEADRTEYLVDEEIILSIQTLNEHDRGVGETEVKIYLNNNLLITKRTDYSGKLEYHYKPLETGIYSFKVISDDVESNMISVTVDRQNSNISIEE